ncbi:preprotein translocase subunit YajC [Actinokineospora alba]|uniref:Preprotein translocase subunit YajC n=1 Tax=Actinokineospora alba TaxID=504798 RepID=A0A1H0TMX3_9PSEU|nr:preprotein translocase subunit YajC [Actinokineospora alba]TDP70616.1 preprotein translocase subunit YajC [Actinokineospora alba]SDJ11732.1 preprotein translocase subunit YajC [Actinokineospora alba]SDP55402.1 preprotein translocase subunit YajC [Actinokineospora alba]
MNQALLPLLLVAVLAIPLILGSRRQKKMVAQQQELQNSLAVGDRVMTTSGLYGTVSDVSDDATIGIEIAPGVETSWLRQAVREKVGPDVEDDEDSIEDTDDDIEATETAEATKATEVPGSTAQVAPPLDHKK